MRGQGVDVIVIPEHGLARHHRFRAIDVIEGIRRRAVEDFDRVGAGQFLAVESQSEERGFIGAAVGKGDGRAGFVTADQGIELATSRPSFFRSGPSAFAMTIRSRV